MPPDRRRFEAVVFDFGGVLITSISNQLGGLAASHDVDVATMLEVIMGPRNSGPDHPWHRAERGEIAVAEIQGLLAPWAEPRGLSLHGDEMERLLAPGGYTVVTAMLERVAQLRSQGYRTGLLTNTFAEFQPTMQRDIDFDLFDVVVESFAVGSRKPERAIYETTQDRLGVEQVLETQTGRAGTGVCDRLVGGSHVFIIDHMMSFERHRTVRRSSSRASASAGSPTWIVVQPNATGSSRFCSKSSRYTIARCPTPS